VRVAAKPDVRFRGPPVSSFELDRTALRKRLEAELEGEVRFRPGDRALYATGGSNYRMIPIGVVIPKSVDDVLATLAACREHGAPVLSRGGGTSLAGQIANVAVVIDFSKYLNEVIDIDPQRKLARVQPGLILDHLRKETEAKHGLTYGPDPSTHDHCTFGGMIGNNSCGVHSVMSQFYGPGPVTADNVEELDVVTYRGDRFTVRETPEPELDRIISTGGAQGEIYKQLRDLRDRVGDLVRDRYPPIPRRVSGYNLDRLLPEHGFDVAAALTGTESTCVTVLEATVRLIDSPPARSLLVLGYDDSATAGDDVPRIMAHEPLGLEGVDDVLLEDMTLVHLHDEDKSMMPRGHGFLLVELGGETKEEADAKANALVEDVRKDAKHFLGWTLYDDKEAEEHVWAVREAGLGATAFIPGKPDTYEGWEDSAVPPDRVGDYIRVLRKLAATYGYESALYGHYGQGCIHARWNFDLKTKDGIATFRRFLDDASDLVLSMGGSLSGEHGDGQSRAELLPKMFGDELVEAFREFKSIWDPDWKMNPGKVVDPYRITDNLRLGTSYAPIEVEPHFAYPDDNGSFAHATVRCVGIGKCRRTEGGVMCPSYMVLRDEKHTTRGRAHLLFEMLEGEPVEGVWQNDEVFEALDLCLACKGCTNDCPVHVDMPTLKAEFLAQRYEGRLRPRHAYAFGLIDQAARVASLMPGLVNAVAQAPGLSRLAKAAAGMAPEREVPRFAPQTLQRWFEARGGARNPSGKKVLLWPDTFNNHFHTEVGVAAVESLEAAGYHVVLPEGHVCCGRPLYDYGFLGLARKYLERTLDLLRDDIRAGTPVVGIEPSCTAVFKDELGKLLPHDEDGLRLAKQVFHFAEFLEREGFEPPVLPRKVLLHGHCHHKATGGIDSEQKLLERMGARVEAPDSGCCGLAGSWGYEPGHYDVSMACGERVLLPAAREASTDTLLVADGFSCRTQIEHGARRKALHVAQVLALAQTGGTPSRPRKSLQQSVTRSGRLLAGALVAGGAIYAAKRAWPT
jgi:FAD/FMN-containing dehydrogenase/Fe-S oxidoreductase